MADLGTLQPQLIPWAKWIFDVGKRVDGRLVVTSARRSPGKQAELYARYKAGKSLIPANRPGTSLHEYGLAFDLARLGKDPLGDPLLAWLGSWWEYYGGQWGGARDPVHFQPRI